MAMAMMAIMMTMTMTRTTMMPVMVFLWLCITQGATRNLLQRGVCCETAAATASFTYCRPRAGGRQGGGVGRSVTARTPADGRCLRHRRSDGDLDCCRLRLDMVDDWLLDCQGPYNLWLLAPAAALSDGVRWLSTRLQASESCWCLCSAGTWLVRLPGPTPRQGSAAGRGHAMATTILAPCCADLLVCCSKTTCRSPVRWSWRFGCN